ncbi:MAG: hypothetical protein B7Y80_02895 [Hyphomicrobium sp. 32-62-53]|nr:MAG: hypothetical protein B7Z29_03245 [Hyphomicrobium sp. 12-62-95]OYY01679.1 MAG: hypothetical protein B7Y80_02895 [Hyphomicrobium sp. 32-62-53]
MALILQANTIGNMSIIIPRAFPIKKLLSNMDKAERNVAIRQRLNGMADEAQPQSAKINT